MKKKLLFAAGAMIIAAAVLAAVCLTCGQTRHNDLFEQNLDALARGEGVVEVPCIEAVSVCYVTIKSVSGKEYHSEITGFKNETSD